MNIDDPKLTAFALGELDESERSTIAHQVAQSPEAQRAVDQTREIARALKNEFAVGLRKPVSTQPTSISIREESWFWSVARPLAIAAAIAVLAIVGAILLGNYSSRRDTASSQPLSRTEIQAEEARESLPAAAQPSQIANPLRREVVQSIDRVVVGELNDPHFEDGELRLIEIINDAYRVERLKQRLSIPVVSKKSYHGLAGRGYELVFLDRAGRVVASAHFVRSLDSQVMLQPRKSAYEQNGRYFVGGDAVLPGEWQNGIDYTTYSIDFPDWNESIGYAPGA